MYTIKITYDTGDSFHTENDVESKIGYAWNKEEDALKALMCIKEHYKAYQDVHALSYKRTKKRSDFEKERWFYKSDEPFSDCFWEYTVVVPDGKGGTTAIDAFWCGYFESLESAEVVMNEEHKITF